MTVTPAPSVETFGGYRHEAFLYSGLPEFLSGTLSFIRRAVSAGDPVLAVVSAAKIDLLRQQLGAEAGHVAFADMADVGDNPARIIAQWQAFVQGMDTMLWVCAGIALVSAVLAVLYLPRRADGGPDGDTAPQTAGESGPERAQSQV